MIWQAEQLLLLTVLLMVTSEEIEDIVHMKAKKFKEEVDDELQPKHSFGGYDSSYLGSSGLHPSRQPPGVGGYPYPGGDGTGFGGVSRPHGSGGGVGYPPITSVSNSHGTPYNKGACNVLYGEDILHCYTKSEFFLRKFLELQQYSPYIPEMEGQSQTCKQTEAHGNGYQLNFSGLQQQCLGPIQITRVPYHLYNTKGEMRFIVQDPPNLQQCYSESICRRPPVFCSMLGYAPIVPCKPKSCYHTLLAWDPTSPQLGPFFDTFEYVCCCHCQTTVPLKASPFFNRFGKK